MIQIFQISIFDHMTGAHGMVETISAHTENGKKVFTDGC